MYLVVWEYRVRRGREREFGRIYGSRGAWARLFRSDPGYLGTRLLRHTARQGSYLTLDLWTSRRAYQWFRRKHRQEYERIDAACARLTRRERRIAAFSVRPA